jgi:hypothetical protein
MKDMRDDWDNVSTDEKIDKNSKDVADNKKDAHESFAKCKEACELDSNCKQYSWKPGNCGLSRASRLGHSVDAKDGVKSGWFLDRIDSFVQKNSGCAPIFITK